MGAKTVNRAERVKIRRWLNRLAFGLFVAIAIAVVYVTNVFLTERFTESTRNRAEVRMTLYVGNLISELQRNSIVPQLLARDPELLRALSAAEYSLSTQRLLSFVDEIGAASLMLLDKDGRTVAATDRNRLGENHRNAPYYINALRSNATIFTTVRTESGGFSFVYSRKMDDPSGTLGVMTVAVDLQKLERSWASISDAVFVADSEGTIILSTEPRWRGLVEEQALARQSPASAIHYQTNKHIYYLINNNMRSF